VAATVAPGAAAAAVVAAAVVTAADRRTDDDGRGQTCSVWSTVRTLSGRDGNAGNRFL